MPGGFVVIARYQNYLEAEVRKLRLEQEGIPSNILGAVSGTVGWNIAPGASKIGLEVREEDAERAIKILEEDTEPTPEQ